MATATPVGIASPNEVEAARASMRWQALLTAIALVIAGLGIGWLVGLSVSPVVSIVITSVTASAAAIIAAMSGLNGVSRAATLQASPVPMALMLLGMLVGSTAGVMARSQNWLGSDLSREVKQWTDLGMKPDEVVNKLFAVHYADPSSSAAKTGPSGGAGLNSVQDRGFCQTLKNASDADLLASMKNPESTPSILTTVAKYVDDAAVFRKVFDDLCAATYF